MKLKYLWGSASTLDGIQDVIAAFYAGERKTLQQASATTWTVHRISGDVIQSVIVVLQKGRYRFGQRDSLR